MPVPTDPLVTLDAMASDERQPIPRIWEVDWAIPAAEGGTRWAAYDWLLETAAELDIDEVSVVAATYANFGYLTRALGSSAAEHLRVKPHGYIHRGITVRGVSRRGFWSTRGPVLVSHASDATLSEVEGQRPPAVAAVASWPDDIATWRSLYDPKRIGQVRPEQEAEFDARRAPTLDPRAADAFDGAAPLINEHHALLDTDERETVAGALISLFEAHVPVAPEGLRAHLMRAGWTGELIEQVLRLAERVARGERPRHHRFPLRP